MRAYYVPYFPASFRLFWLTDGTHFGTQKHFRMTISITQRPTRNGQKIYYTLEWGKGSRQRTATGIFTYAKPKDQLQKKHGDTPANFYSRFKKCVKSAAKDGYFRISPAEDIAA